MISTSFGNIRPWMASDAEALVRQANNRNVSINLRDVFPFPYTPSDAQEFLAMATRQEPTTVFAIATPDEAIGGIGLVLREDVHRLTAELGFWLGEAYWGRGIMTETVVKFTDYAFERFQLVRIYAEVYANNAGSCRVLEKAGFQLEGRLRSSVIKDDKILDQFIYARVRPQPPVRNSECPPSHPQSRAL